MLNNGAGLHEVVFPMPFDEFKLTNRNVLLI
jgi:hypothetical protein